MGLVLGPQPLLWMRRDGLVESSTLKLASQESTRDILAGHTPSSPPTLFCTIWGGFWRHALTYAKLHHRRSKKTTNKILMQVVHLASLPAGSALLGCVPALFLCFSNGQAVRTSCLCRLSRSVCPPLDARGSHAGRSPWPRSAPCARPLWPPRRLPRSKQVALRLWPLPCCLEVSRKQLRRGAARRVSSKQAAAPRWPAYELGCRGLGVDDRSSP